jgi:uncharacterized membrane protein
MNTATAICSVTKNELPLSMLRKGDDLHQGIFELVVKDIPTFTANDYISIEELNMYRRKYLEKIISENQGEINSIEKTVIDSIANQELLVENIDLHEKDSFTLGQRIADKVASFGGSWTFIIFFFSFILIWMMFNTFMLMTKAFDPFPYILLNLILSCLAAIQAPIIMMSQNRQEEKDRMRSEHDYKINLKAELEIRMLHEKLDHLLTHQNQSMFEVQQLQTEYFEDILKQLKNK